MRSSLSWSDGPRAVLAAALLCCPAVAQKVEQRTAPIGVRARIEQLVLPGSELVSRPAGQEDAVLLRVLKVWPHGELLRYDLEWVGYEPGEHDLAEFLVRKSAGEDEPALPPIMVEVTSHLPPGQVEPSALEASDPPRLGGYRTLLIVAGALWVIGLLAILFGFRRRKAVQQEAVAPPPTLADRLRPIVEQAARGELDMAGKARLERLLLAFWRERAGLADQRAAVAIVALRKHEQAGALLRKLEEWLHMPTPPGDVDVGALLEPYRQIRADAVDVQEAG